MQFQVKQVKNPVYNIIGDGGMSLPGLGEGRFIPCLIIDANNTSEISDLIKHHQNTDAGDAVQQWGRPLSLLPSKHLILQVKFTQPMEVSIGISFELKTQYSLIDGIIQSRAFFLQIGQYGDKVSNLKSDKILIESPDTGFDSRWNNILFNLLKSRYRANNTKSEANKLAIAHIKKMRELWGIRRKD